MPSMTSGWFCFLNERSLAIAPLSNSTKSSTTDAMASRLPTLTGPIELWRSETFSVYVSAHAACRTDSILAPKWNPAPYFYNIVFNNILLNPSTLPGILWDSSLFHVESFTHAALSSFFFEKVPWLPQWPSHDGTKKLWEVARWGWGYTLWKNHNQPSNTMSGKFTSKLFMKYSREDVFIVTRRAEFEKFNREGAS